MRIISLILALVTLMAQAQTVLPLTAEGGHVYAHTYTADMKPVSLLIDTGASSTLCGDMRLMDEVRKVSRELVGINGKSIVRYKGKMDLIGVTAEAYLCDLDGVDGILGLDWMLEHKARIDLGQMTIEYY